LSYTLDQEIFSLDRIHASTDNPVLVQSPPPVQRFCLSELRHSSAEPERLG
jgi:hypothetical protein